MEHRTIGLALSGGGQRAAAFALGAVMYLVDSGRHRDVKIVSSVSGGSITSAYLSLLDPSWNQMEAGRFRICARHLARQLAGSPGAFRGAWMLLLAGWIAWFAVAPPPDGLLGEGRWTLAVAGGLLLMWAIGIGPRSRGAVFGWWGTWLYVGLVSIALVSSASLWLQGAAWYWALSATLLTLLLWGLRGVIVTRAFCATIRAGSRSAAQRLDSTRGGPVRHVYCATEAHSGRHCFLTSDYVYSPFFGVGVPGSLSLGAAIQASACLPGAFPYTTLWSCRFSFTRSLRRRTPWFMVLSDGGVYDNTGTTWFMDADRTAFDVRQQVMMDELATSRRAGDRGSSGDRELSRYRLSAPREALSGLLHDLAAPDDLVAVNASYPRAWSSAGWAALPLLNDLMIVPKSGSILYNKVYLERIRELRKRSLSGMGGAALLSIEENPSAIPLYLTRPDQWLDAGSDAAGSTDDPTASDDRAARLREMIAEGQRFYTRLDYPTEGNDLEAFRERARNAMAHLFPGYLGAIRISDEEAGELQALTAEIRRLHDDVERREHLLDTTTDREELRRQRKEKLELELAEIRVRTEIEKRKMDVRYRRPLAEIQSLRLTLPLHRLRLRNARIGTHLSPLGAEDTAGLLYHGYLSAMVNLSVLIGGYPLLDVPTEEGFSRWLSGEVEDPCSPPPEVPAEKNGLTPIR